MKCPRPQCSSVLRFGCKQQWLASIYKQDTLSFAKCRGFKVVLLKAVRLRKIKSETFGLFLQARRQQVPPPRQCQ